MFWFLLILSFSISSYSFGNPTVAPSRILNKDRVALFVRDKENLEKLMNNVPKPYNGSLQNQRAWKMMTYAIFLFPNCPRTIISNKLKEFLNFSQKDEENFYKVGALLKHVHLCRGLTAKYEHLIPEARLLMKSRAAYLENPYFFQVKSTFVNVESESYSKIKKLFTEFKANVPAFLNFLSIDDTCGMESIEEVEKMTISYVKKLEELILFSPLQRFYSQKKQNFTGLYGASPLSSIARVYCPPLKKSSLI